MVFFGVYAHLLSNCPFLPQVSQVYQSMKIETLSKMIPFFDFSVVEKISVDAVKYNFFAIKVDHRKGAAIFGNEVCPNYELLFSLVFHVLRPIFLFGSSFSWSVIFPLCLFFKYILGDAVAFRSINMLCLLIFPGCTLVLCLLFWYVLDG